MKHQFTVFAILFSFIIIFSSCLQDTCTSNQTYVKYEPIYISAEAMRTELKIESPKPIKSPGKFYYYKNYIMINEPNEGIHIIDNSNPANPNPVAFWNVRGNVDIAIKNDQMYLDQYVDMTTYDVSNFLNPQFLCRRNDVFRLNGFDQDKGYLIEYKRTTVTEEFDCQDLRGEYYFEGDFLWANSAAGTFSPNAEVINPNILDSNTGVAGSYTRFCFNKNYLYTIDQSNLRPFTLNQGGCPVPQSEVNVGWNIETIFPYKDHLFIGSQTGVFIYDASDEARPQFKSNFTHATGCDPVVCDGDLAFVTIHGGTTCNGNINQLDVLDIKNLSNPILLEIYPMKSPNGLALTSTHIYLCDDGLKILERNDHAKLKIMAHFPDLKVTDAIVLGEKLLLLIGEGGFYQFDITDPLNPQELSKIAI